MKNLRLPYAPLLWACMSLSVPAFAATNLTLSGQIAPSACTLSLSNNGEFAYGDIERSDLNDDTQKWIRPVQQTVSINCHAPMRVALKFTDNRTDSIVAGAGWYPNEIFGLGHDQAGNPIGGYYFYPNSFQLDGVTAQYLTSHDSGQTWTHSFGGDLFRSAPGYRASWTTPGSFTPAAFYSATGLFKLVAGIDGTDNLDDSRAINLNGLTTMELVYL